MLLATAAGLLILLGVAHSYLGERYILIRLFRRPDLPKLGGSDVFTRQTLRFAWHLTSVAWWGFAALRLTLPFWTERTRASGHAIAITFAVSSVVAFVGSRGRHLSWAVFLVVAVLTWLALP